MSKFCELVDEIKTCAPRPGNLLVIRVRESLNMKQYEEMARTVKHHILAPLNLHESVRVVILENGADIEIMDGDVTIRDSQQERLKKTLPPWDMRGEDKIRSRLTFVGIQPENQVTAQLRLIGARPHTVIKCETFLFSEDKALPTFETITGGDGEADIIVYINKDTIVSQNGNTNDK